MTTPGGGYLGPQPNRGPAQHFSEIYRQLRDLQKNIAGATTADSGVPLSNDVPQNIMDVAASGGAVASSRSDHVHASTLNAQSDVVLTSPATGDVVTWNGTSWVNQPASGGGVTLSSTTPLSDVTPGSAGVATTAARGDHAHSSSIQQAADTTIASPAANQVLTWTGTAWANRTPASGVTLSTSSPVADGPSPVVGVATTAARGDHGHTASIQQLTDTSIGTKFTGQALVWNGTSWVNTAPTTSLSLLSDTTISSPTTGQTLTWNGSHWVNSTPSTPAPVSCFVQATATISLTSSAAPVAVPFNVNVWDPAGQHSTTTNTTRITVANTGLYVLGGAASFAPNALHGRYAFVQKNGTTLIFGSGVACQGIDLTYAPGMAIPRCPVQLTAGDYIELMVGQNSGGALTTQATGQNGCALSIELLHT